MPDNGMPAAERAVLRATGPMEMGRMYQGVYQRWGQASEVEGE